MGRSSEGEIVHPASYYEAEIRELAAQRYSSGDIAAKLDLTRNQVIGFCWRRKIPLTAVRGKPRSQAAPRPASATGNGIVGQSQSPTACDHKPRPDYRVLQPHKGLAAPKPQNMDNTDNPHGILFSEFVSGCRFPIGDPKSKDFKVCGNLTVEHLPYCVPHARVAFQKRTRSAPKFDATAPVVEKVY